MTSFYLALAVFLLANFFAGFVRIAWGPTPADRMMAAQLFGTIGVGVLVLLAHALGVPALRDVALVFALLGALALVAFVNRVWPRLRRADEDAG
jgi:multicomponent Na+:H+ antiporter subunit F